MRSRRLENPEKNKQTSKRWREKNADYIKERRKEFYNANKQILAEKNKIWRDENKEYFANYQKDYREKNKKILKEKAKIRENKRKQEIRKYKNERHKIRRAEDPVYRLKCNMRSLIGLYIRKKGFRKNSGTEQILGCSFEELKQHLESQFKEGMSWENRSEWHIDHIIPISYGQTEEEILALNHYTNLQPLWAEENIAKGNRYTG
jgi:hypothetical protein